ncbi:Mg2 transporter protein, CorA-like/Zinc transport protein ZntB [Phaffia rhodozyma]|uniref:Mg2 transporter protein, CorA-like/Zinc transport protein ZntB n=1 Tax=Phaffia rhodozyma TaxID=264483 RepID=A0A0F7SPQ6_PHARH|nr:Mg2 transporter protein, CorA-like/Zinc transport protein ZntB [Phaffia rhodozyma]
MLSSSRHGHHPSSSPLGPRATAYPSAEGPVSPLLAASRGRPFNPLDPDHLSRQRDQDLDSARAIYRARSNSIHLSSPPLHAQQPRTSPTIHPNPASHQPRKSLNSIHLPQAYNLNNDYDPTSFPALSFSEQADVSRARGDRSYLSDNEVIMEHESEQDATLSEDDHSIHSHHDVNDDTEEHPSLSYNRRRADRSTGSSSPPLLDIDHESQLEHLESPAEDPQRPRLRGSQFDFSILESWAGQERSKFVTLSDQQARQTAEQAASTPIADVKEGIGGEVLIDLRDYPAGSKHDMTDLTNLETNPKEASVQQDSPLSEKLPMNEPGGFSTRRQRRVASLDNKTSRRQGKLAMFEGAGAGDGAFASPSFNRSAPNSSTISLVPPMTHSVYPQLDAHENFTESQTSTPLQPVPPSLPFPTPLYSDTETQERPFRFSFYSNALPATIHARSLYELPAEGQTFEDLFGGRSGSDKPNMAAAAATDFGTQPSLSGTTTPRSFDRSKAHSTGSFSGLTGNGAHHSLLGRAVENARDPTGQTYANTQAGTTNGGMGSARLDDVEATTWWLDVTCPTDQEMRMLSKVFGLHPLTTEDIQLEETREKIELFRNYYLVCFRSFVSDVYSPTHLAPLNMYIVVFREGVLSFHFRETPHPQNVRRRIASLKDYISVTSDWISYALIDDITDAFGPLIQSIEYEVDSVDELVLIMTEEEQSDMLRRIGTCRKKVMGLLRLMGNKADVVKGLAKRCNENWSVAPRSDIGLYLSDIQDHLITMVSSLNHFEKILSRSHSNYLAQISIEMTGGSRSFSLNTLSGSLIATALLFVTNAGWTDANNQMNDVLSRMTAIGTILIPMNLVTGMWGMNVHVPGKNVQNLGWFFGIVGMLVAFGGVGAIVAYRIFKYSQ